MSIMARRPGRVGNGCRPAWPEGRREGDVDLADVAELARLHDLHQPRGHGVVLVVERLHHDQAGVGAAASATCARLVGVGREGLLAQHVLAGLEGGDRPVAVETVGQRDVDGVDLGVARSAPCTSPGPGECRAFGECRGPVRVRAATGHDGPSGPPGRLDAGRRGRCWRPRGPRSSARGHPGAPRRPRQRGCGGARSGGMGREAPARRIGHG